VPPRPGHGPGRRAHTTAADSPLDTAALLSVIALIGLIIFLLWM